MTLVPFDYDGQEVRVVEINGEPWFVGTDVARVLGYVNPSDALGRLDPDERSVATLALSEGSRIVTAKGAVALAVMLNVAPADLAEALTTLDEEATA